MSMRTTSCPKRDRSFGVSTTIRPVTQTAEVAVNKACTRVRARPGGAAIGSASSTVPTVIRPRKPRARSWAGERGRRRSATCYGRSPEACRGARRRPGSAASAVCGGLRWPTRRRSRLSSPRMSCGYDASPRHQGAIKKRPADIKTPSRGPRRTSGATEEPGRSGFVRDASGNTSSLPGRLQRRREQAKARQEDVADVDRANFPVGDRRAVCDALQGRDSSRVPAPFVDRHPRSREIEDPMRPVRMGGMRGRTGQRFAAARATRFRASAVGADRAGGPGARG